MAAGTDRNHARAQLEPELALLEIAHHASGGLQAIGAAAGQQDGLDLLDGIGRIKQVSFPGTRGGASHIHAAHSAILAQDDGAAGRPAGEGVMADLDPGHVCDGYRP